MARTKHEVPLASRMRRAALVAFALARARPALAHPRRPPAPHDLAAAWGQAPLAILGVVALGAAYAWGAHRLHARAGAGRGISRGSQAAFGVGWLALAVALASPLHALGGALFSAHMAQHELLIVVAAPLLMLGRPLVALAWALPRATHRAAARASRLAHRLRVLVDPWVATAVHGAALWLWHAPPLYGLALRSEAAHAAQHVSFLGTALLFWWAVLDPARRRRATLGTRLLLLFLTALHSGALGALITFADRPLIAAYLTTTAPWGLTPLEDQQLAGLIMWIPGGIAYLVAVLAMLGAVLREEPTREVRLVGARLEQRG
jgi:putative membrane protein